MTQSQPKTAEIYRYLASTGPKSGPEIATVLDLELKQVHTACSRLIKAGGLRRGERGSGSSYAAVMAPSVAARYALPQDKPAPQPTPSRVPAQVVRATIPRAKADHAPCMRVIKALEAEVGQLTGRLDAVTVELKQTRAELAETGNGKRIPRTSRPVQA